MVDDIVILSVRPQDFQTMEFAAEGKLVISVMAGVSASTLAHRSRSERIVRAMPNAAVEIGRSYTPWFASEGVTEADKHFVQRIFASCGTEDVVRSEADIDYFTGLSGAGPAWPALLADAMVSHALAQGIDRQVAERAVKAVVCDAGQLLASPGESPERTVQTFVDYRGTTAAGLNAMIASGFREAVYAGLDAAARKAKDMASAGDGKPSDTR